MFSTSLPSISKYAEKRHVLHTCLTNDIFPSHQKFIWIFSPCFIDSQGCYICRLGNASRTSNADRSSIASSTGDAIKTLNASRTSNADRSGIASSTGDAINTMNACKTSNAKRTGNASRSLNASWAY